MNKYKVNIWNLISEDYEIEAECKSDAIELALAMFLEEDNCFKSLDIRVKTIDDEETE